MISINFPDMFNTSNTKLVEGNSATLQNIHLLLDACRGSLLGDPYFGTNLKKYIYEQNNVLLRDIITDHILVALQTFIPQIHITRKDIKLRSEHNAIYATINCINKLDNQINNFEIKLITD